MPYVMLCIYDNILQIILFEDSLIKQVSKCETQYCV